jgi:hypothetical protein
MSWAFRLISNAENKEFYIAVENCSFEFKTSDNWKTIKIEKNNFLSSTQHKCIYKPDTWEGQTTLKKQGGTIF